jgi:hypothetical protein
MLLTCRVNVSDSVKRMPRNKSRNDEEGQPIEWLTLLVEVLSGDVLLSHTVPRAVPSALRGLASGFGM